MCGVWGSVSCIASCVWGMVCGVWGGVLRMSNCVCDLCCVVCVEVFLYYITHI